MLRRFCRFVLWLHSRHPGPDSERGPDNPRPWGYDDMDAHDDADDLANVDHDLDQGPCEGLPASYISGCKSTDRVRYDYDYGRRLCVGCWSGTPIPAVGRNRKMRVEK